MSPQRLHQIVGAAEVMGAEYASGIAFEARNPVTEHAPVCVLDASAYVGARHEFVRHQHRVANSHLAEGDVGGTAFACLAGGHWDALFNGEHMGDSDRDGLARTEYAEFSNLYIADCRYHLITTSLPPFTGGGSGWSPELARVAGAATTSTTYYFKRRAREGYYCMDIQRMGDPRQYDANEVVEVVAEGVRSGRNPHRYWAAEVTTSGGSHPANRGVHLA